MRIYELVLIVRPVAEAQRKKTIDGIKALLTGLKIQTEKEWGSKALRFKINGELTGFYYDFELVGDVIPTDFEKKILQNDLILRHLVIRKK